jgi:hypothetical protein
VVKVAGDDSRRSATPPNQKISGQHNRQLFVSARPSSQPGLHPWFAPKWSGPSGSRSELMRGSRAHNTWLCRSAIF